MSVANKFKYAYFHVQTLEQIQKYYKREKYGPYVVDPHTAVGLTTQERSAKKA